MARRFLYQNGCAAIVTAILTCSVHAQEMFNVNVWSVGRPASRGGIWGDGVDDEAEFETIMLDGDTPAGAPGWNTVEWENVELDPNPFAKSTPATTITGTQGSSATFEMFNRRNAASYNWNGIRSEDDEEDFGNATLLDAHVNSTEFDGANGSGNPFGFQISDFEIRDIPFSSYDAVFYFGINSGQTFSGNGTIRINDDVDRPSDPTDWGNSVLDDGPLDMSGGIEFTLPMSLEGFEPDGILDEIESPGDTGNYIVFSGLTEETLMVQTWGEGFTHLGIAGFQLRGTSAGLPGDYDADGELDADDLDLQAAAIASGENDGIFDLNGDDFVDFDDRLFWVKDLKQTWVGDANLDGEFNSADLVAVFQAGIFESETEATWSTGDWNADLRFTSNDFVAAFSDGGFERGPVASTIAVPEPESFTWIALTMIAFLSSRSQRR